jgi:hypothetical protein
MEKPLGEDARAAAEGHEYRSSGRTHGMIVTSLGCCSWRQRTARFARMTRIPARFFDGDIAHGSKACRLYE